MYTVRRAKDRGHANHGWLDTYHTFSFADYYDPEQMGFGVLRVINEDTIDGGMGFATHGHRDMEIITYVTEGALEHKDTLGSNAVIRPGDVQRMSAGTGIRHSEFNHLKDGKTHLLQIWILPEKEGLAPGYGQKNFTDRIEKEGFALVASRDGRDGSIGLNQDVNLYAGKFKNGDSRMLETTRTAWVQVIKGDLRVNEIMLASGDGLGIEAVKAIRLQANSDVEFLYFDLPR